jgi:hypothetical protein
MFPRQEKRVAREFTRIYANGRRGEGMWHVEPRRGAEIKKRGEEEIRIYWAASRAFV